MTVSDAFSRWTIDEYRGEFIDHGLSGQLWPRLLETLGHHVRVRLARRYRAALYSPSGEWDQEGIYDLVNEFLVELGIGKGLIARALMRTDSTAAFIAYLERSLHRYVLAEGGQSVGRNIYHRLHAVLAEHPQLLPLAGIGRNAAYGDVRWRDEPPPAADAEALRGAERFIPGDVRITEYRTDVRRSPVLAREALGTIAVALVEGVRRLLTARQVLEVIGRRFELREAAGIPGGEDVLQVLAGPELDPLERMVAEDAAERLLASLTARQREVLRYWVEDPPQTAREIADYTGIGKSTVNNEQHAISKRARDLGLTSFGEYSQVLELVAKMLEEDHTPA